MSNKANAKADIAQAITRLDDAQRADVLSVLGGRAHRLGNGGLDGDAGRLEKITRYASKVAKAENAKRGRDAGSPRALPGSTCVTVVRDLCALVAGGMTAEDAHAAQRSSAQMGERGADAAVDSVDLAALFA